MGYEGDVVILGCGGVECDGDDFVVVCGCVLVVEGLGVGEYVDGGGVGCECCVEVGLFLLGEYGEV